jgi:tetratricopeptide (TPR) repeat protein
VAAAGAARRVFGYAEAAAHWQRAVELAQAQPGAAAAAGADLPTLYAQAADALHLSGDNARAGVVAEEACHRFASHPDPATAAAALHRAGFFRAMDAPAAGLPLLEDALRLFAQAPPSFDHAKALLEASVVLLDVEGRSQARITALNRALEIAEAADATALIPRILPEIAYDAFIRGQVEEGLAALERG